MNGEAGLWISVVAYGAYILESFILDWKTWANKAANIPLDWPMFYVSNLLAIVLGIASAAVGWKLPEFSLAFPMFMCLYAFLVHIVPFLMNRKYSPGLIAAGLFLVPVGIWSYYLADKDGICSMRTYLLSAALAALYVCYPRILFRLKGLSFFRQN